MPADAKLIVSFNRPVVPLVGVRDQATLPAPLAITPTVKGKGEWLNTSIYQFTPEAGLASSTRYTVTVKSGLQDTLGAVLPDPVTFAFRTTDPTVLSWLPAETKNVKVEAPISVTFSLPMDPASTEAAFRLADELKQPVAGTFNWNKDRTQLGFKPERQLHFGTGYTAQVGAGARPGNGQGSLRVATSRSFTTVYPPQISNTTPRQGVTNADPNGGVSIGFVSPLPVSAFITGTYTVLPKPAKVVTGYSSYEGILYLNFDKLPATVYTVTLSGKLADGYGNTLGQDYVLRFTTRDYDPMIQLTSPGQVGTYNAYTPTQAVVLYRNVPQVNFGLYRVPVGDFISLTGRDYWQKWDKYAPNERDRVRSWTAPVTAARNKLGLLRVDLTGEDGKQLPPGLYYLSVTAPNAVTKGTQSFRQLFARTALNVTLKTEQGSALAWVTDLQSGQPVAGASIRFADGADLDKEASTNADGVARITFTASHRQWDPLVALATAEDGGLGVTSSNWEDGIGPWNFNLPGGGSAQPYMGYIYTDRPIYRPGQTVYWNAIIRRDNDALYELPAPGMPVTVTIRDDQGTELYRGESSLDAMGSVNGKYELGPEAGLGYYNVLVELAPRGPNGESLGFGIGFQVAEYRKPEYEISAQTDKPEYIQDDQVKVTVQASYFFGGPVKNGKVRWTLLSNDYFFSYQGKGNYSFADWDWFERNKPGRYGGPLSQGQGTTDDQGRFTFVVPADITKFTQSQRFSFDITIEDLNNQSVSTQAAAVVHKGSFYIGLQPEKYVGEAGSKNRVQVLTVDTESKPVPGQEVTLVVNRVTWFSVREQLEDGNYYWNTRSKLTPVYTETVTSAAVGTIDQPSGTAVIEWTPTDGGEYKVEATGRDRGGHTIRSAAFVWVSGRSYVNWRQDNNDRIELVADKDQYAVGDTASLLVASPYQKPVKALVTIERNTVLTYEVIDVRGNSETLRVPIKPEFAPDVFVSIVLVKGMDETSPAPTFRMGLAQLKVLGRRQTAPGAPDAPGRPARRFGCSGGRRLGL